MPAFPLARGSGRLAGVSHAQPGTPAGGCHQLSYETAPLTSGCQPGGEQQSVVTPHTARGWAHPPCIHVKIQSCCCLGSAFEVAETPNPRSRTVTGGATDARAPLRSPSLQRCRRMQGGGGTRKSFLCEGVEVLLDVATVECTDDATADTWALRNLALRGLYTLCILSPTYRPVITAMGARFPLQVPPHPHLFPTVTLPSRSPTQSIWVL
jgi:hypothetical protein